jgi:hypothetical protein
VIFAVRAERVFSNDAGEFSSPFHGHRDTILRLQEDLVSTAEAHFRLDADRFDVRQRIINCLRDKVDRCSRGLGSAQWTNQVSSDLVRLQMPVQSD